MITAFTVPLLLLATYYGSLMGAFAIGFRRVVRSTDGAVSPPPEDAWPFVSVVVAARNEESTITDCLAAVLANDYPANRFEVIVVDDFSDDATAARVRALQHHRQQVHVPAGFEVEQQPAPMPLRLVQMAHVAAEVTGHKRDALARGIEAAQGDLILTTDADCTAGPQWIRTMVGTMTSDTAFVAGPVAYATDGSRLEQIQALEFLGLIAVGAGGIGIGHPNMCNSANVAYRRSVYRALMPASEAPASPADDEVLLQRIAADTPWKVAFCAAPEATVATRPVTDLRAFLRQRQRWAGTGARYPRPSLVASIALVYVFYALLLGGLLALPFVPALALPVGLALVLKTGAEAMLLYPACRHFRRRSLFRYFVPAQLLQIPYVVLIGAAGAFGSTHWKGRRIT